MPTGALGSRWSKVCLLYTSTAVAVDLPRFDVGGEGGGEIRRGVPTRMVAGHLVTTVFDLLLSLIHI